MITGVWMDEEDGANRLLVQLDEDEILLVDFRTDPVTAVTVEAEAAATTVWTEMGPR